HACAELRQRRRKRELLNIGNLTEGNFEQFRSKAFFRALKAKAQTRIARRGPTVIFDAEDDVLEFNRLQRGLHVNSAALNIQVSAGDGNWPRPTILQSELQWHGHDVTGAVIEETVFFKLPALTIEVNRIRDSDIRATPPLIKQAWSIGIDFESIREGGGRVA